MREILPTLDRWAAEGVRAAAAILVAVEKSAPLAPGAVLAVSDRGDVVGSVTGGCVEPALYEEARTVLDGGPARLLTYGVADEDAFDVGLPCGGTVHLLVTEVDAEVVRELAAAVREERPVAMTVPVEGDEIGRMAIGDPREETGLAEGRFAVSLSPRPRMYVFGALDHAAALAEVGRLLGYHVTVCDARAKFATRERFPAADEVVVEWPDRFLASAPIDRRSVVCVLTHDARFDVPVLKVALASPAGYVGAMGARRVIAARTGRLREEGVSEDAIARVHAPIGLPIGSRTAEEVAVAIGAEIVAVMRDRAAEARSALAASSVR